MPQDSGGLRRWEVEDLLRVEEMRREGNSWNEIGVEFGVTRFSVMRAYGRAVESGRLDTMAPQEPISQETTSTNPGRVFKENKALGEADVRVITFSPIKTEQDALRVAEVDLSIWYVHSWECRQWTTPMNVKHGQKVVTLKKVKGNCGEVEEESLKWRPSQPIQQQQYLVSLKLRRKSPQVLSIETLLKEISSCGKVKLPNYTSSRKVGSRKVGASRRALEVSLMDPHLGLKCYQPAADMAWSLEETEDAFMSTTKKLIHQAKPFGPFEEIVVPIGNDYFHADTVFHTTTAGTHQPEMEPLHEVYVRGKRLMLWYTETLRELAPIKLLAIPGNHDRLMSFTMAMLVEAYYEGAEAEDVVVDASSSPYKFWSYGVNLIGFEHGHSVKPIRLAALMANETRLTHWQGARYCEWHLGDQHRKGSARPSMLEEQGVSVEYLPSLTPPNEWHRLKSFNWQKRGAMGFVYDYDRGPVARLQVNFDSYTGKHLGDAA